MHVFVDRLARLFAQLGGLVLLILILMTCLSVLGRSMNGILHSDIFQTVVPGLANALLVTGVGPVNGDFEMVEMGMAFTIFAFIPLCQLNGAHASVDILTNAFSASVNRVLRMTIEIVFAAVMVLIAVQLFDGLASKRNSGQITFLLEVPVWWGYAGAFTGAAVAAAVAVYVAAMRAVEAVTGTPVIPADMGADH